MLHEIFVVRQYCYNKGNSVVAKEKENDSRQESEQHDRRGQEDLRRTSGRVQERPDDAGHNQKQGKFQRTEDERTTGDSSGLLTEEQAKQFNSIDPSIRAEEWRDATENTVCQHMM